MYDYYQILAISREADLPTIEAAYQTNLAKLTKTEQFDKAKVTWVKLTWDETLKALTEWQDLLKTPEQYKEFLELMVQDIPELGLVCNEVKIECRKLSEKNLAGEDLVNAVRLALYKIRDDINKNLIQFEKIKNAFLTLKNEYECSKYRNRLFFCDALKNETELLPELVDLVATYAV